MKKSVLFLLALLSFCACTRTPSARISGSLEIASDSTLLLQKVVSNQLTTIDTLRLDAGGAFRCEVPVREGAPVFCHVSDGTGSLAALVLLAGDEIRLRILSDGDYTVEGSEESLLLKKVNDEYRMAGYKLNVLADALAVAADKKTEKALRADLGDAYVSYRRFALAHALSHPQSITSAALFFQKFGEDLPVFGELTDVLVFKQVYDSIQPVYPHSEYVLALADEIRTREKLLDLNNKIDAAGTVSFPELTMPDIEGQTRNLSDLSGKVILLSFWSVTDDQQKMFNHTLADLYAAHHKAGLEIYQVSLDVDKSVWASTVRSQQIPWISVNDGSGSHSRAVSSYNVRRIPALFVINRKGDIVGRDIFEPKALEALVRRSL